MTRTIHVYMHCTDCIYKWNNRFAGFGKHTRVCCSEYLCSVGKVDLQAFVKMKCYATVLPDVPREISSQSPVDAAWAVQIKRLQHRASTFHRLERLHSGVSSLWGAAEGHLSQKSPTWRQEARSHNWNNTFVSTSHITLVRCIFFTPSCVVHVGTCCVWRCNTYTMYLLYVYING